MDRNHVMRSIFSWKARNIRIKLLLIIIIIKPHAVHIMVFGGIWRYRMQRFRWQTHTICATGANVECHRKKPPGGGEGVRGMVP